MVVAPAGAGCGPRAKGMRTCVLTPAIIRSRSPDRIRHQYRGRPRSHASHTPGRRGRPHGASGLLKGKRSPTAHAVRSSSFRAARAGHPAVIILRALVNHGDRRQPSPVKEPPVLAGLAAYRKRSVTDIVSCRKSRSVNRDLVTILL
jgi:hypothetical protein